MYNDGRTVRRLGTYPRISSWRVEVFDVQSEISFCKLLDQRMLEPIPSGAFLGAIALGSIAHLVGRGERGSIDILDRGALETRLHQIVEANLSPVALVLSIANAEKLIEEKGTAFVNRVLAQLFSTAQELMPSTTAIGVILPTQLACVREEAPTVKGKPAAIGIEVIDSIRGRMSDQFGSLLEIHAGIFSYATAVASYRKAMPNIEQNIDKNGAIDLASYALVSLSGQGQEKTAYFDIRVPSSVLYASRRDKAIGKAEKDFETIAKLGVMSPFAVNHMALAYYETNDYIKCDRTYASYLNYVHLSKDKILNLNVSLAKIAIGDVQAAASWLITTMDQFRSDFAKGVNSLYFILFSRFILDCWPTVSEIVSAADVRLILETTIDLADNSVDVVLHARIRKQIDVLNASDKA